MRLLPTVATNHDMITGVATQARTGRRATWTAHGDYLPNKVWRRRSPKHASLAVSKASASARQMKLRNSLFRMVLYSASTLHLAVDAKIPVSGHTVLPGPGGQTTTVQGSQRPQFKAERRKTPRRDSNPDFGFMTSDAIHYTIRTARMLLALQQHIIFPLFDR